MAEESWSDVDLTPLGVTELNEGSFLSEKDQLCPLQQVRMTFLRQLGNCLTLQLAGETLALNLEFDIIVWKLYSETSHLTV